MLQKGYLTVLFAAIAIFAFGMAQADQIDGLGSGAGNGNAPLGPTPPTGVYVNPGGLGDALVFGYYNTRSALNFFRIVNTSDTTAVKARIRFREAKFSREILDFNICLSASDQWSAWIFTPGGDEPAGILSVDTDTMTAPAVTVVPFFFEGTAPAVLAGVTADDTREGYFEVIGTVAKQDLNHGGWTAAECTDQLLPTGHFGAPNSLAGNNIIFNLVPGAVGAFGYNATALANCTYPDDSAGVIDQTIANETPTFDNCTDGLAGVDYALTKTNLIAMYNDASLFSELTNVIVTFPTKRRHVVNPDSAPASWIYNKPFDTVDEATRCEPINVAGWNDQEDTTVFQPGFSPSGPGEQPLLCNEVNVITINSGAIVDSQVTANVDVTAITPKTGLGWLKISLDTGTISCAAGNSTCFSAVDSPNQEALGLPAVSYDLTEILGILGSMVPTQYSTTVR